MKGIECVRIAGLSIGLAGASAVGAAGPVPVSPGNGGGFATIASACPTFSWSAADGARGYELLVYEVRDESGAPLPHDTIADLASPPVIRHRIAAQALTWTPPKASCLALGGAYGWSVRAVGEAGAGDWSAAALFAVAPDPVLESIGGVLEGVLSRYLEERGVPFEPDGELAAALARELAGAADPSTARAGETSTLSAVGEEVRYASGRRLDPDEPIPQGVFVDDVELWLEETDSGMGDKVQLVFATPEFDGSPSDAWSIVVDAFDSASPDDGKMFFSTPSFGDALQLFTDGSAILGEQRELQLRRRSSPPIACTSFLQEGMLYWDQDINALCACDGSSWVPVDADETGSCV